MESYSVVLHFASLAVAPGNFMSRQLDKPVPDKVKKGGSSCFGKAVTEEEKEGEGESITADSDAPEPGLVIPALAVQPTMLCLGLERGQLQSNVNDHRPSTSM